LFFAERRAWRYRLQGAESGRSSRLAAGRQFGQGVDDRASGWRVDIRPLTSRLHQRAEQHLSGFHLGDV